MEHNLQYGYLKTINMITIGIIDDNSEQRDSFRNAIELFLKKQKRTEIDIYDSAPIENIEDYSSWIVENEICVLILDEKLMEIPVFGNGKSCDYNGHELAEHLRKKHNNMPIHIVTSAKVNEDLKSRLSLFENVISRDEFLNDRDIWVEKFIRSGQRFYEENEKLYSDINMITNLIIEDKATPQDIDKLKSIQEYFKIPLLTDETLHRDKLLKMFCDELSNLTDINNKAKDFINSQKK